MKVKKLHPDAIIPTYTHEWDAGMDLYSIEGFSIFPLNSKWFKTGLSLEIPLGKVGIIMDRSSMAARGISIIGGVIDYGYTGEILVGLHNRNPILQNNIYRGDKIAQLIIMNVFHPKIEVVDKLSETERGEKGFGSSDLKYPICSICRKEIQDVNFTEIPEKGKVHFRCFSSIAKINRNNI